MPMPALPHPWRRYRFCKSKPDSRAGYGEATRWDFPAEPVLSSGFDELDRELPGGGWPTRNLTELLLPAEGLGEIG